MNVNIDQQNVDEQYIVAEYEQMIKRYQEILKNDKIDPSTASMETLRAAGDTLCNEYNQFASSYPIVVRYITMGLYSRDVFARWLVTLRSVSWKTHQDFLMSQATFASMLMKSKSGHYNPKELAEFKQELYEQLLHEHEEFSAVMKKRLEAEKQRLIAAEKERLDAMRKGLKEQLKNK